MAQHIDNYLPLARKYFKHELWNEKRPFSRAEAWLWLIKSARYVPGDGSTVVHGHRVQWKRGELSASIRYLRDKWGWGSCDRVLRFLNYLEEEKMITKKNDQFQTVIRLNNYPKYNPALYEAETNPPSKGEKRNKVSQGDGPGTQELNNSKTQNSKTQTQQLVETWNQANGTSLRYTRKKETQVRQRLKTFSMDELQEAIRIRGNDPWIKQNKQQSNWDALFRNDEQIEKWRGRRASGSGPGGTQNGNALTKKQAEQFCKNHRLDFDESYFNKITVKGEERYIPTI